MFRKRHRMESGNVDISACMPCVAAPEANAVLTSLQCISWFNPPMHLAASRCRFDQELACDADVMARTMAK